MTGKKTPQILKGVFMTMRLPCGGDFKYRGRGTCNRSPLNKGEETMERGSRLNRRRKKGKNMESDRQEREINKT